LGSLTIPTRRYFYLGFINHTYQKVLLLNTYFFALLSGLTKFAKVRLTQNLTELQYNPILATVHELDMMHITECTGK